MEYKPTPTFSDEEIEIEKYQVETENDKDFLR